VAAHGVDRVDGGACFLEELFEDFGRSVMCARDACSGTTPPYATWTSWARTTWATNLPSSKKRDAGVVTRGFDS
jgi:hypothetical protein